MINPAFALLRGGQGRGRTADLPLIRKSVSCGSAAALQGAGGAGPMRSGGGFEGDFVAEGFELADVVVCLAAVADAGVVIPGAEVGIACGGVG
jgi:hypothetical protein